MKALVGEGQFVPHPAVLTRRDIDHAGRWDIKACPAQRGEPHTIMVHRKMAVPIDGSELARSVRAHEMMHAKVSPPDWRPYWKRGLASQDALESAEEARINFLIKKVGFDVKVMDWKEDRLAGEALAEKGLYDEAVYYVATCSGLGGFNKFIAGVKKVKPEWVESLKQVHRKVQQALRDGYRAGNLASTKDQGGFLEGMSYTEAIAQFLDECIEAEQKAQEEPEPEPEPEPEREDEGWDPRNNVEPPKRKPKKRDTTKGKKPRKPAKGDTGQRTWHDVVVKRMNLNRPSPGGIGVKKIPSNRGRNPRFPHRALVDPHKRIFERKLSKGKGGIVLLDVSGSMRLEVGDIWKLVEASPGCTVAAYGIDRSAPKEDNLFILAERGKMVSEIEGIVLVGKSKRTNGNDGTALEWALAQARATEPVILVSDGGYHFGLDSYEFTGEAKLSMQKLIASDKRISHKRSIPEAIKLLQG